MTGKTRWGEVVELIHPDPSLLRMAEIVLGLHPRCRQCGAGRESTDPPFCHRPDGDGFIGPVCGAPMGGLRFCPTCGGSRGVAGLTAKCRDWHEVCQCGARYDEPKAAGCRRRKHRKEENR